MFTGIIETHKRVVQAREGDQSIQMVLARPTEFDDIKVGDSIACNGVCLTVEKFDDQEMTFTIGHETLRVTGWTLSELENKKFNLERSLRFGDRIHGHMVSGHVDCVSQVTGREDAGDCLIFEFEKPKMDDFPIWAKSSVAINGVSLTVNDVTSDRFNVCLVPETLKKTNLENLAVGESVNLEADYYMKGILSSQKEIINAQPR